MRTRTFVPVVAVLFAAVALITQPSTEADTFGSGANTFSLDFVNIGNAGNAADTTGFGDVPYEYRMGKYEISQSNIDRAVANGLTDVMAGAWTGNQPAANISWYEAAAFVNWLNTSTGKQAAYNLTFSGSWSMNLWNSEDAWQAGGENLYRHKDAHYFLPSDNEWYKAAYYNPTGSDYFLYPTASNDAPNPISSGTDAGTAVYAGATNAPAGVDVAGGLSGYETMGQGGNVWEWNETFYGTEISSSELRIVRGDNWRFWEFFMRSSHYTTYSPSEELDDIGFRVASVPEPSTYALLAMSAAGALWLARRKR